MPELLEHEVTAVYVGLRAATEHADYQVSIHADEGYACVGGIRSTGLSGSMAIAEHVRGLLEDAGLALSPRPGGPAELTMPNIGEAFRGHTPTRSASPPTPTTAASSASASASRAARSVTPSDRRCPPVDLDGLRRRTRAHMGRCQGFFCGAELAALIEERAEGERRGRRRRAGRAGRRARARPARGA